MTFDCAVLLHRRVLLHTIESALKVNSSKFHVCLRCSWLVVQEVYPGMLRTMALPTCTLIDTFSNVQPTAGRITLKKACEKSVFITATELMVHPRLQIAHFMNHTRASLTGLNLV